MHRLAPGVGATIAALTLAACSVSPASPANHETPAATEPTVASAAPGDLSHAPTPAQTLTPTSTPTLVLDEDTGEPVTRQAVPEWDEQSRAAAVAAAEAALTAFARPDLDHDTWWSELTPLLTQQAQYDYAQVAPANIRVNQVVGPGVLVGDESAYVARVEVPTSVGTYLVILTRDDAHSPWLTARFTPPKRGS